MNPNAIPNSKALDTGISNGLNAVLMDTLFSGDQIFINSNLSNRFQTHQGRI